MDGRHEMCVARDSEAGGREWGKGATMLDREATISEQIYAKRKGTGHSAQFNTFHT